VIEVAVTLLVDRRGWVLMQERDERAPVAPNQWGLVGGYLEEGERRGLDVGRRPGR
jgi:8-oxo-dGTP diphosphatase